MRYAHFPDFSAEQLIRHCFHTSSEVLLVTHVSRAGRMYGMQLDRSVCCVHCGPAQFLKQAPQRVFRSSTLLAARSFSQQSCGRAFTGNNRHYNDVLFPVPAQQSIRKQKQLCQAAQQPDSESFQASSDLRASSSSSSIPSSQSPVDDSRQASNAAASTSASPASETGPDESSFRQFLSQPAKAIAAFLQRIAKFLKSFPAYIQREKLQRLHKKALDEPTNAERYSSYNMILCIWGLPAHLGDASCAACDVSQMQAVLHLASQCSTSVSMHACQSAIRCATPRRGRHACLLTAGLRRTFLS